MFWRVEVKTEREGDTLTALLRGEIDHHAAGGLREEIDTAVLQTGAKTLILDFSGISFMDSSGIGVVLGLSLRHISEPTRRS